MKRIAFILVFALLVAALFSCGKDQATKEPEVTDTEDNGTVTSAPDSEPEDTEAPETSAQQTETQAPEPKYSISVDGVDISEFTIVSENREAALRLNTFLSENVIGKTLPVTASAKEDKPLIVIDQSGLVSDSFTFSVKDGSVYFDVSFNTADLAIDYFCGEFLDSKGSDDIKLTDLTETVSVGEKNISEYILKKSMEGTEGNCARLVSVMKKAKNGEKIVIAALGGSITQGSGANSSATCYVSRIYSYFKALFPETEITLVNAGIGATSSAHGIYRLQSDVLDHDPDIVIVEYACNDAKNYEGFKHKETYENVVRECLKADCAVLQLCVPNYVSGQSISDGALGEEKQIGKHYDVPVISVTDVLRPRFNDGTLSADDYSKDGTHPNEDGHALVASIVTAYFDSLCEKLDGSYTDSKIPSPLTSDIFSGSVFLSNEEIRPADYGSFEDDGEGFQFKNAWLSEGGANAAPMVFELKGCKTVSMVYLVTPTGNGYADGRVTVEVDGKTKEFSLEADIETWGKFAAPILLYRSEDGKTHDVKISVYPGDGKFSVLRVGKS